MKFLLRVSINLSILLQVEGAGVDEGLPEALAAIVRPAALAEYEKTLTAVFNAGAEVRSHRPAIHSSELIWPSWLNLCAR